jgi:hypothetical protein
MRLKSGNMVAGESDCDQLQRSTVPRIERDSAKSGADVNTDAGRFIAHTHSRSCIHWTELNWIQSFDAHIYSDAGHARETQAGGYAEDVAR